jgi:HK97 gp10 family phage protein
MDIVFDDITKLTEKIDTMVDEEKLRVLLGKATAIVEADAKKKAPKGDGTLRNSIASRVELNEGVVYTPLEYAPYVEYGTGLFAEAGGRTDVPWVYQDDKGEWHTTSGMKPHPYMRPALEENREKIMKIFKEGLLNG